MASMAQEVLLQMVRSDYTAPACNRAQESWLITGGAGFIGTNFIYMAAERSSAKLVVLDKLTYAGNLVNLQPLLDSGRIEFVRGDICDQALLDRQFGTHGFQRVFHFAAESHVDRSILGPDEFVKTNVNGTCCLLQATRQAWEDKTDGKLFLHVSTDEVFGDLAPDDPPFCESTPYNPSSPYSASKAASDHMVRAWHHTYGLPVIITNCSNNYGPWQFPEKFIPLLIANALEGKTLPVYGDGLQIRDWLHVSDHCEALLRIAECGRIGQTYAIGGNNERTNISIAETVCDAVDIARGNEHGTSKALIRHVTDRPGHDRRYAISSVKIESQLDWRPRQDFDQAIKALVEWFISHQDWVSTIQSGEYQAFYNRLYGEN